MNLMAAGVLSITFHSRQVVEGRWKVRHATFQVSPIATCIGLPNNISHFIGHS